MYRLFLESWRSNNDFQVFISSTINNSLYRTGISVSNDDRLIILVTCDTRDGNKRIIVIGKQISLLLYNQWPGYKAVMKWRMSSRFIQILWYSSLFVYFDQEYRSGNFIKQFNRQLATLLYRDPIPLGQWLRREVSLSINVNQII